MNAISGFNPNISDPNLSTSSFSTNKYDYGLENNTFKHQVIAINNKVTSGIGQMINTIKASNSRSLSGFVLKYRVVHQLKNAMKALEKLVGKFENGNASVADLQSKYEAYANKFSTKFDQIGNKLKFVEGTLQKDIFNNAKTSIDDEKKELSEAMSKKLKPALDNLRHQIVHHYKGNIDKSWVEAQLKEIGAEDKLQEFSALLKESNLTKLPDNIVDLCKGAMREAPLGEGGFGKVYASDKYVFKVIENADAREDEIIAGEQYMETQEKASKDASFYLRGSTDANMKYCGTINVGGQEVLILERAKGNELFDMLNSITTPDKSYPEKVTRLLAHAAQGLAGLHAKGLVHLDIKPENLMVHSETKEADGTAKHQEVQATVIDPGMARTTEQLKGGYFWGGTPGYMAPEILKGSIRDIPQAADVYSFGVTIYNAFFGWGADKIDGVFFHPESNEPMELYQDSTYTAENLSDNESRNAINEDLKKTNFGKIYSTAQRDFILKLISDCVQTDPAKRPTMAQVGGMLEMFQIANVTQIERARLQDSIKQGNAVAQSDQVSGDDIDLFDKTGQVSYEKVKNYVLTDIAPNKAENAALA